MILSCWLFICITYILMDVIHIYRFNRLFYDIFYYFYYLLRSRATQFAMLWMVRVRKKDNCEGGKTFWQLRIIIERVAIVDWPTKCQRHDFIQNLLIKKFTFFVISKRMTECGRKMVSQTSLVMRNYCLLALYEKLLLIIMQIFTYMWYPYRCYHQSGHSTVETRPRKTPFFKWTHAFW